MNWYSTLKTISIFLAIWSAIQSKMDVRLQELLLVIGLVSFQVFDNLQYNNLKQLLEKELK